MKIKLNKCEDLGDWYTIIRQEHEGKEWLDPIGNNGFQYMNSERISDACVEGTAFEMIEIAQAIKSHSFASFKRCAVSVEGNSVSFYSPRNSTMDGVTTLEEADEFANQVLSELGGGEK